MEIIKIINLTHWILIFGLSISIFINNYQYKKISLSLLILILIQFIINNGKCGLTEIEYLIKGEQYKEGIIYQFVKPIITIPENYIDKYFYILHILWIWILWKQLEKI